MEQIKLIAPGRGNPAQELNITMTTPYIFSHDRPDDDLSITFVLDVPSGKYSAFYDDLPGLLVVANDKEQAQVMLEDLFVLYIKSICKIK